MENRLISFNKFKNLLFYKKTLVSKFETYNVNLLKTKANFNSKFLLMK